LTVAAFGKKQTYDIISNRQDKRQSKRKPVDRAAYIRLGGFATRPCTVIDYSDSGVRISVDNAASVPAGFTLLFSKDSEGRSARVKWRRGNQIGAEFI
jgi:hypothetical protein